MKIKKTTIQNIKQLRKEYFKSLPEFQELFLEIMMKDSHFYALEADDSTAGYAVLSNEGVLIEFYLRNEYVKKSLVFFVQVVNEFSIKDIYCKSFDALLMSCCIQSNLTFIVLGRLYRGYDKPSVLPDPALEMKDADLTHVQLLLSREESIRELFDTEEMLREFISHEKVYLFYKNNKLTGCGMVLRTHQDWNYCDLGVWVSPSHRGQGTGARILLNLRQEAIKGGMLPSCGCAIDNIASQKTIEKSGYYSKYEMLHFKTL